jgi:uncharacterized protein involved in oxidation of intracellular sulfur
METLTMILTSSPYGDEKLWNALRIVQALVCTALKIKVNIFLLGDAVTAAKRGQNPPQGYYNLGKMLKELTGHRVEINFCRTCLAARGIAEQDLVEGAKAGTMINLAKWIEQSQKTLSF